MRKTFLENLERFGVLLVSLLLVSCTPNSSLRVHADRAELTVRAPDVFDVRLETSKGEIVIEIHRNWAPHGADRFYHLVRSGYYDDSRFFRVIQGRWAQFGINGNPEVSKAWRLRTIPDDRRIEPNERGTVAFAFAVPNGRTTQVFINLKDNRATHDREFVPFGTIIKGMETADALNSEYGESAGGGIRGGKQDTIFEKGNSYLKENFPRLDFIRRATVLEKPAGEGLSNANSSIQFDRTAVQLAISQVSDRALRIGLCPLNDERETFSQSDALVPFSQTEKLRARELSGNRQLRVGQLLVRIKPHPLSIAVQRADGTLVQELVFSEDGSTNSISFRAATTLLGLCEGADQFDRRGAHYPVINGQRYRLAELGTRIFSPFLIGTEGWSLFVNAPAGSFDLRGERGVFHPQSGTPRGTADLFIIDSREPIDAMREFVRLTGKPVMPPKWALGYMQSRRTLSSEADILAEARTFREKKLPCDAFIFLGTGFCPAGWNLGHDSFQFNTNIFVRDPASVIQDLHAEHLRVVLHVVPLEKDYPSLHGQIPPGADERLDQQDISAYWRRHTALFAAGVDGWWPDEGDWLDAPSRLARHRMYYEGPLSDRPNVRPWNLQRNGTPGIGRYGGWVWSGDILSSWKTLKAQVKVGLNSSLSLSPFWGTDIGGFYPSTNMEYTGELYARWFQFATFCPSFRSHGRTWWLHRPWGWNTGETGPIESRPAPAASDLHNASIEPICQTYLNLRYQ
ncbi:MAG TPA: TIM-barrel domain-containing protein, partial [Patescibacteria group bacterium]|nr:TIM-barrel domain-containing protein [Patescibacteria group bacterium]